MRKVNYYFFLAFHFIFLIPLFCKADDPGIHKTRILQVNDSTYIIDVDVPQNLIWSIKAPIFPDRFSVSEIQYIESGQWFIARVTATSSGEPLNHKDKILFPWLRNGADITAQWLDGSINKALFIKSIEGIVVPMDRLIESKPSNFEVFELNYKAGIYSILSHLIIFFFLIIIISRNDISYINQYLLAFFLGSGFSLIFCDFINLPFPFLFTIVLFLTILLLITYSELKTSYRSNLLPWVLTMVVLFFFLAFSNEISDYNFSRDQLSIALFSFQSGLISIAFPLFIILFLIRNYLVNIKRYVLTFSGAGMVAIIIFIFGNYVKNGETNLIQYDHPPNFQEYQLPVSEAIQSNKQMVSKSEMTSPLMSYLSISPYELRHEVLLTADLMLKILGVDSLKDEIPASVQGDYNKEIAQFFKDHCQIELGADKIIPDVVTSSFVTLSASGVLYRSKPQAESLNSGLMGVSMIFELKKMPDSLQIDWTRLNSFSNKIEVSSIDPFSNQTQIITDDNLIFKWKNLIPGYKATEIKKIHVDKLNIPLVAYLMTIFFGIVYYFNLKKQQYKFKFLVSTLLVLSFLSIPFLRVNLDVNGLNYVEPNQKNIKLILHSILTNIYKSFEARNEELVYDRLSQTVYGEELTNIYLNNRKALEFEDRGGARAVVDYVDIQKIHTIHKEGNQIKADIEWLIGGSVNHFGHTHYRQNQYRAYVSFSIHEDSWKISGIELIEEERVL